MLSKQNGSFSKVFHDYSCVTTCIRPMVILRTQLAVTWIPLLSGAWSTNSSFSSHRVAWLCTDLVQGETLWFQTCIDLVL